MTSESRKVHAMKVVRSLMVAVLPAAVLAGCGASGGESGGEVPGELASGGWSAIVDAANDEGEVVMYSVLIPSANEALEAAFEEKYPEIDLVLTRLTGGEIDAALDAEKQTGKPKADIVNGSNYPWIWAHLDDGTFVRPQGPAATAEEWTSSPFQYEGLLQTHLLTVLGPATNTELVDDTFTSFTDVIDPELKGQIGIVEAVQATTGANYNWLEQTYGKEFLEELAGLDPVWYESASPMEQALASGEISVALTASAGGIQTLAEDGAPVEFHATEELWAAANLTYLLDQAPHPNAAQVLYDFMASPEGQTAIAAGNVSVLDGIKGTIGTSDQVHTALSTLDIEQLTSTEWATDYSNHWHEIFKR
jgi:iron(III) transport system substrate-binding protein